MITDRQKLILKAIIEEYIDTTIPVGSKVLTEKPYLRFSSATLRYEMQFLEEIGFLEKTHTSSGRIPSELGYRYYVEHLITRNEDVSMFKKFDDIFDDLSLSKEEAIKKTMDLLSDSTGYMTVINGSSSNYSVVKKMEIVPLGDKETILLIVTSDGSVQSQRISIPDDFKVDDLLKIIDIFDNAMYDRSVLEIREVLSKEAAKPRIRKMLDFHDDLFNFMIKCFTRFQNADYYSSGLSKIFNQPEFHDHKSMQKILNMLDDNTLIEVLNQNTVGLSIIIGNDNCNESISQFTIVSVPFFIDDDAYGVIAVLGPIRMQYKEVIPLIEYVAKGISKLYSR